MVRYLTMLTFTEEGIRHIKQTLQRAAQFRQKVEAAGGQVLAQYWAVGQDDGCVMFEVPDEQTGSALLVGLEQQGYVRPRSMRIYDAHEFEQVIAQAK